MPPSRLTFLAGKLSMSNFSLRMLYRSVIFAMKITQIQGISYCKGDVSSENDILPDFYWNAVLDWSFQAKILVKSSKLSDFHEKYSILKVFSRPIQ